MWSPSSEDKAAWSAVGGVVTAITGGGAIAWGVAAASNHSGLPVWPVYPFGAFVIAGLYIALAPLLHRWPWRREESFARELRALRRDGQSLLDELPGTVADFAPFESHVDACRDRMEAVLLDAAPEFVTRLRGLDGYWDSKMDGIPRIGGPRFVDTYLSDLLAILDDAIAVVRK